ncbi:MAG: hypothetical protein KGZ94_07665 [Clostridia bacterium]|nr:hypothetical protein [Clostridia bacterium]
MTFSGYLKKVKYSGTAAQKDPSQPSFKAELGELTEKASSGELLDQLAAEQLTEQAETSKAAEQEARLYTDPRPDLEADSVLWTKLLRRAQKIDPMLAGTLHGFRCGGLRIKRGRTGYLLRPDFDPSGNLPSWRDQEEYEHDKLMHLFQYRAEIKELMSSL